jgi:A/G-specific adenine glycosylase
MTRRQHEHDPARAQRLRRALLAWYARARRALPWRVSGRLGTEQDAYAVWLSEIMLQQTRVETVVPYYERFLAAFPTVHALAEAPLEAVLARWSGLGYYRRARMLHAGARAVVDGGGAFPDTVEGLRAIPGIGEYTAGAVASIAFGQPAALVDGNVARVLARIYAIEEDVRAGAGRARAWSVARALVPSRAPGDWNQALMELGALVCTPRAPACGACPVRGVCAARARGIERELPHLTKKKPPVVMKRAAVVARCGARVLLARRAPSGTFGGMWEPPSIALGGRTIETRAALEALAGGALRDLERTGDVVHVLSHRRIEVEVYRARLAAGRVRVPSAGRDGEYDALAFHDLARSDDVALTTFARKILAAGGVETAGK